MKVTAQKKDFNQYGERFHLILSYSHANLPCEISVEISELDYEALKATPLHQRTEAFEFPSNLRERITLENK